LRRPRKNPKITWVSIFGGPLPTACSIAVIAPISANGSGHRLTQSNGNLLIHKSLLNPDLLVSNKTIYSRNSHPKRTKISESEYIVLSLIRCLSSMILTALPA